MPSSVYFGTSILKGIPPTIIYPIYCPDFAFSASHCSFVTHFGVQACIAFISSFNSPFTSLCRCNADFPLNASDTISAANEAPHPPEISCMSTWVAFSVDEFFNVSVSDSGVMPVEFWKASACTSVSAAIGVVARRRYRVEKGAARECGKVKVVCRLWLWNRGAARLETTLFELRKACRAIWRDSMDV